MGFVIENAFEERSCEHCGEVYVRPTGAEKAYLTTGNNTTPYRRIVRVPVWIVDRWGAVLGWFAIRNAF